VLDTLGRSWYYILGGQFWVGYWYGGPAYVSFFTDVCGLELPRAMKRAAQAYRDTAESACWWWPHRDFVMACERPTKIERDERGRLHCETGMAIQWSDGWGLYRWHGVAVPAQVIEAPETITVAQIEAETNAEVRRCMVSRYGAGRYLLDSGAKELARDEFGVLYRKDIPGDEPLVMVRVLNSTPEPDGTLTTAQAREAFGAPLVDRACAMAGLNGSAGKARWKEYFLRVHPELRPMVPPTKGSEVALGAPQEMTARNAVASTFGLRGEDWSPTVET
jgi:hypothetical protein